MKDFWPVFGLASAAFVFYLHHPLAFWLPKLSVLLVVTFLLTQPFEPQTFRPWKGACLVFFLVTVACLIWVRHIDQLYPAMIALSASAGLIFARENAREWVRRAAFFVSLPTAALLLLSVLGRQWPVVEASGALPTFFGNASASAHALLLGLPFGVRLSRGPRAGYFGFMGAALLVTGSKAAWLAAFCFILLSVRRTMSRRRLVRFAVVLVPLLVSAGIFLFRGGKAQVIHNLVHPQDYVVAVRDGADMEQAWIQGKPASLMVRRIMWENTLYMIADRPFTGWGPHGFFLNYPRYSQAGVVDPFLNETYRGRFTHNLLLEMMVGFGIPLALFLFLLLWKLIPDDEDTPWDRDLVFLQLVVACFAVNYAEPWPLFVFFSMLRPAGLAGFRFPNRGRLFIALENRARDLYSPAVFLVAILAVCLTVYPRFGGLDPGAEALTVYRKSNDVKAALHLQIEAWRADPYGTDVVFNLGTFALLSAREEPDPTYHRVALLAFRLNQRCHPFYKPEAVRARLEELGVAVTTEIPTASELEAALQASLAELE